MKGMLRTGARRVRRAGARLGQRTTGTNRLILLYHRVADVRPDPWGLSVSPARFMEHLEVLSRSGFKCLRLRDLVRLLQDGTLPRRAVAITFDDGYADNLYAAKPLLERTDTPATVFVVTGATGRAREFWWDELAGLLLQPDRLPAHLTLAVDDQTRAWELGTAADDAKDRRRGHGHGHQAWTEASIQREAVYRSVWQLMQPLPEDRRQSLLDELAAWAGRPRRARAAHRSMTADEILALAEGDLIDIGAHTVTHPSLPFLPRASQRAEIAQSKARCEALLGRPVTSFSYPHGEYTSDTVALVRETGFACACSTAAAALTRRSDPFRLPRLIVENWDGNEFARRTLRAI